MKFIDNCASLLIQALNLLTLSPWEHGTFQRPIGNVAVPADGGSQQPIHKGPIFSSPHGPDDFFCDYSAMGSQWRNCTSPQSRDCWLTNGHDRFDIQTDYEQVAPKGTTRRYWLDVANMTLQGDGYKNIYGKVFNQSYPGPWIKACWGDELEITVTNHLQYNGTTIHWHGIRQLHSMEMDGVNGVTQCPIAPGDTYTYRFKALQYGTSWYHSHYALQYGDGVLGPLTIFGPSSANYDEAIDPTLITDNLHDSAFTEFHKEITPGQGPPKMVNILLNGTGISNCSTAELDSGICVEQPNRYNVTFTKGKKYLMRLINTSVDTTFIFAIDNHNLTVIEADFVPINPYITNSVLIGIGQRYHVVVEADPIDAPRNTNSFWMRTVPATGCFGFVNNTLDVRTGILYYSSGDHSSHPTTSQSDFPTACSDEPYDSLIPVVPWTVGLPANTQESSEFQVGLENVSPGPLPPPGQFNHWELGNEPLWINFSDPTILHVDSNFNFSTQPSHVVVPQNVPADDWVYLLISASGLPFGTPPPNVGFLPVSHPIHLHGHDFAILSQSNKPYWPGVSPLTLTNPPRRDVALLEAGGYLLIAFKADNPGAWLVHCHIAWHASSGLAVQVLERDGSVNISSTALKETTRVCDKWDDWFANKNNWYESDNFQDDSGI